MLAKDAERTGMRRCRLCWVKEDEQMAADLEKDAREKPEDSQVQYQLSSKYIVLCRYDDAFESAKKAIELGLDDERGYGMLGRVCVESGRLEEGYEASIKAFKINADNPISSINLAIYYSLKGNFETAMDYFEIAEKLAPGSHRLYGERGLHYARVGLIHEALEDLKKAINLQPCNQDYYHNMSDIYLKNNRVDEARKILEISIQDRPGCSESFHALSNIYSDRGEREKALKHIEKAIELSPDNPDFAASMKHITENLNK